MTMKARQADRKRRGPCDGEARNGEGPGGGRRQTERQAAATLFCFALTTFSFDHVLLRP